MKATLFSIQILFMAWNYAAGLWPVYVRM